MNPHPTPEQARAVLNYALAQGRGWKTKLLLAWERGWDAREEDGALLRQVRNGPGPRWLTRVTTKQLESLARPVTTLARNGGPLGINPDTIRERAAVDARGWRIRHTEIVLSASLPSDRVIRNHFGLSRDTKRLGHITADRQEEAFGIYREAFVAALTPKTTYQPDSDLGEWRIVGRYSIRLEHSEIYSYYRVVIRRAETEIGIEDGDGYTDRESAGAAYHAAFKTLSAIERLERAHVPGAASWGGALMATESDETPTEFLRRLMTAMNYEHESILDDLPTTEAVIDYFKLWDVYNTEFLAGIEECIADGEDPEPLNAFIIKHSLPWTKAERPNTESGDEDEEGASQ